MFDFQFRLRQIIRYRIGSSQLEKLSTGRNQYRTITLQYVHCTGKRFRFWFVGNRGLSAFLHVNQSYGGAGPSPIAFGPATNGGRMGVARDHENCLGFPCGLCKEDIQCDW